MIESRRPSCTWATAAAVLDGDEWVLNGEKIFVTAGCRADGVVVWATIDKSAGRAGIKSFLIEKGTPGFIVSGKEKKLGIRLGETTPDGRITLKVEEECLAACAGGPMMAVDGHYHENLTPQRVDEILDALE